jgi:uracil-DNA glycosylase
MELLLSSSWEMLLREEFEKTYFKQLVDFLEVEYQKHKVYPPKDKIFAAFNHCAFEDVKVVILGQDPYHGFNQANGLSFSVEPGVKFPPSLKNIFKEIKSDIGIPVPLTGDLIRWAKQGVLLLNATLTVRASQPGSHQMQGWEIFTDAVIQLLSDQKHHLVFLLWGAYAQKKGNIIDRGKHYVLESAHPSPFSAHRGFFGNRHFSLTNQYLSQNGKDPIEW